MKTLRRTLLVLVLFVSARLDTFAGDIPFMLANTVSDSTVFLYQEINPSPHKLMAVVGPNNSAVFYAPSGMGQIGFYVQTLSPYEVSWTDYINFDSGQSHVIIVERNSNGLDYFFETTPFGVDKPAASAGSSGLSVEDQLRLAGLGFLICAPFAMFWLILRYAKRAAATDY